MNKKTNVLGVLCLGMSMFGFAQQEKQIDSTKVEQLEEVVITDSRFALKRENSGKTVIKISAEELERSQGRTVSQIINSKSGITINGSQSSSGQNLSTFFRGGQNRQVLVLIDGVAVSDPSQIENNYDLQLLSLDQIESIEILKGASSALYGNRASTAIINITLKKASKEKLKATFATYLATNNSQDDSRVDVADFTSNVGFNGSLGKFNYLTSFSSQNTDGLSASNTPNSDVKNGSDRFSKISGNIKLGYQFSNKLDVTLFGNFDEYDSEFDDGFSFVDQDNASSNKQYRLGVSSNFKYKKGSIHLNAAVNSTEREFDFEFFTGSISESKSYVFDLFNKYKFNNQLYTILGLNYVDNAIDTFSVPFGETEFAPAIISDIATDHILDPYANVTYLSDFGLNINAGLRLNNHSEYGSHFVYNINPSYVFKFNNDKSLKVLSSYSTSYITPSLYQLFSPDYGNVDLKPQEDRTIEAGLVFDFGKKLSLSTVYFNRDQENVIEFVTLDFTTYESEYQNDTNEFIVNGVEVELNYKPTKNLDFDANYTFTERKDADIFRAPKHKANASLGYGIAKTTYASLHYQYNGERTSTAFNADFTERLTLDNYSLVDFNINHSIIENTLKIYASMSNIFNEDYQERYGFSSLGRNYRIGIKLNF
ncbi:MAG: TonB-dependent receptor plug domain-containing protein [Algibacter sp.]